VALRFKAGEDPGQTDPETPIPESLIFHGTPPLIVPAAEPLNVPVDEGVNVNPMTEDWP